MQNTTPAYRKLARLHKSCQSGNEKTDYIFSRGEVFQAKPKDDYVVGLGCSALRGEEETSSNSPNSPTTRQMTNSPIGLTLIVIIVGGKKGFSEKEGAKICKHGCFKGKKEKRERETTTTVSIKRGRFEGSCCKPFTQDRKGKAPNKRRFPAGITRGCHRSRFRSRGV